ncbi:MAG TPA: phosphoglucosamine mutase [Candidatus Methanoculleus thermohydrogenotrophicum]|jgi:phosphoglucosamine mutase|nr:phosphoglucosamine mutase [Candidatus Methanoculleus thermohydrogenotrophicum]NLM81994.1 phosphoglucosamine mutase [Candidatus Methanoculleus thermohydrogenotrophicum]HOB18458.1 phosphoglucosamine mutase [Candidatus Methanoculleus thermohydrogenotrophicum]HPZ38556.1 phosphoglucosamine mutase [Candidatus Methanoculleus thermohydrogenotrophicum]HQC91673.1 phosphoglucosamine mutase [Candidatus Methanoculleus thermohydrogenotrophicum]
MLFGSSGIRQEFGADLVDVALRVGSAVADAAPRIVVGRDTRTTSELLEHSVIAGMLSAGATVQTCGIAPTPTVAYAARDVNAGCMITASHNPESYNGVKLLNPDGSAFTRRQQVAIEDALTKSHWVGWNEQGCVTSVDAIAAHQEAILDAVSLSRPVTVVLDCGNGAGSVTTPELLARMGATVIELNCNISGRFARPSEPLEANLPYIGEIVRKRGAACAVIHDGDADRMMAFDDRGRYIDGDHLLILFAKYLDRKRVVTTVDASMAIEEVAEVRRTPVGDSFVSEELLSWGDFGGEASGSWVFPGHSYCPDGVYAAALLCEIASEWSISDELDGMPRYTLLRESYRTASPGDIMAAMGADEPTHGIRFSDDDGWYLIRASGTEPKIRITAEGKTPAKAKEMLDAGRTIFEKAKRVSGAG